MKNDTESPPSNSTSSLSVSGRVIRAALIILPFGTVILGIASFGIWWYKRELKEERQAAYVRALRRDLSAPAIDRYITVLQRDVFPLERDTRLLTTVTYLESTMGKDNMGYNVRRERYQTASLEASNIEVDLLGKKRPHQVFLVLAQFGLEPSRAKAEAHALATLMALAHSVTGEAQTMTLRFAALPAGVKDLDDSTAIDRLAGTSRSRSEQLMQVFVLGSPTEQEMNDIRKAIRADEYGTVLHALPATEDTAVTLKAAEALRETLLREISRE